MSEKSISHLSAQFQQNKDEDGPYCNNCTDDMGEALEWHDRESIHPANRVPCVGCGAK